MKEGDIIPNHNLSTAPRHNRIIYKFKREFNLNPKNNISHSKSIKKNNNMNYKNNTNNNQNLQYTPKPIKTKDLDNHLSSLYSIYKDSIKKAIINTKDWDLLQKRIKKREAEEMEFKNSEYNSKQLKKKKKKTESENKKH